MKAIQRYWEGGFDTTVVPVLRLPPSGRYPHGTPLEIPPLDKRIRDLCEHVRIAERWVRGGRRDVRRQCSFPH
jgi:hypothetical protein